MRHPARSSRRPASFSAIIALTLMGSLLPMASAAAFTVDPATVWINEIHYDNASTDVGEAIEIAGPAGTDLTGWTVRLYNGSGGLVYLSRGLSGTIPDQENGYGTVLVPDLPAGILQNGSPDGIALIQGTTLIQFLSYEGTFAGVGSEANAITSTDIGVLEDGTGPVGDSLRLIGTGTTYQEFTWAASAPNSFGSPNQGQTLGTPPEDDAPTVEATTPANGADDVAVDADLSVTFSEPVSLDDAVALDCGGPVEIAVGAGPATTFTIDPTADLPEATDCTLTIAAAGVSDDDAIDPPDGMEADVLVTFTTFSPPLPAPDLVINEIDYDQASTDTAEFLEIKNVGEAAVSLAGVSLDFRNGASGGAANYRTFALPDVSLAAGDHFVVCANAANTPNCDLDVAPDTDLIQNGAPDAIALVFDGAIVDTVSYEGNTPGYTEGTGTTLLDDAVGFTSISRCPDGSDTDDNDADFLRRDSTPGGANACPGVDLAPTVSSTTPSNGALGVALQANVSITFSEPVNVAGSWFSIECASTGAHTATVTGGPTTFTLDPDVDFAEAEACTVTVAAAAVTDQDADDPPDAMAADHVVTFTVIDIEACGDPVTPIHEIQGSGAASPLVGQSVAIEGVVVGDYQPDEAFEGFFVQDEDVDADMDVATSEGIFVFDDLFGVEVAAGEHVRVRGTVAEFSGLTELGTVSLVVVCGAGTMPTPAEPTLPVDDLTDWEATEGMLVTIGQELTVTETFTLGRFGEVALSVDGRLETPTNVVEPGAPAIALQDRNDRSRILLDDGNSLQNIDPTRYPQGGLSATNTLRIGDTVDGPLTGVLDFAFDVYRIQPIGPIDFVSTNPRPAAPAAVGGNLKVASMNVLNYFTTLDTIPGSGNGPDICGPGENLECRGANTPFELDRQRAKIVSALAGLDADIVGLMEIENNDHAAVADLVTALNTVVGAGTYDYIDTGTIGTDAIKLALIYRTTSVTPVGAHAILDSTVDPAFIDTRNRPSLAQTFERNATGARLTVVVNHLKSKGSACAGDPDTGDGQGNCNGTRVAAAGALMTWLAGDPTGSGDPDVLLIGDMNAYAKEDPIDVFENAGYVNTVAAELGAHAYSYVFEGQSGYLDHALASPSLAAQVSGVADWHINADEPIVLDYNTDFKLPSHVISLYAPTAYRSSDHDPVLVGIQLDATPTVDANGPYAVVEGESITLTASGIEPDGQDLTYAWDLDGLPGFETPGQSVTFSAASLLAPDSRPVAVQVTGPTGLTATDATVVDVIWAFGDFSGPVDPDGLNVVTAGQAVPFKFTLDGDQGPAVLEGTPTLQRTNCANGVPINGPIPVTGSGPTYNAVFDEYTYTWKTSKAWVGWCGTFVLRLDDGTSHDARFRFKP